MIFARIGKGDGEKWGVLDLRGEIVLPFEYDKINFIEKSMKQQFIDGCQKPNGVTFLFYTYEDNRNIVLFDSVFKA